MENFALTGSCWWKDMLCHKYLSNSTEILWNLKATGSQFFEPGHQLVVDFLRRVIFQRVVLSLMQKYIEGACKSTRQAITTLFWEHQPLKRKYEAYVFALFRKHWYVFTLYIFARIIWFSVHYARVQKPGLCTEQYRITQVVITSSMTSWRLSRQW